MQAQKNSDTPQATSQQDPNHRTWALKLFNASPLKQQKWAMLKRFVGETMGRTCLDIGSDNGVISLLFREQGGTWSSADLTEETVTSIRSLVGDNVFQTDGTQLPFPDESLDVVVIVDFLEHIENDVQCVREIARVLKAGGVLVSNVPDPKEGLWRKFRYFLGQTDEKHGHLRPGYDEAKRRELFGPYFQLEDEVSYVKIFSEIVDAAITFALDTLKGGEAKPKGTVITGEDLNKMQKSFKLFRLLYPVIKAFQSLDRLLPRGRGLMVVSRYRREEVKH